VRFSTASRRGRDRAPRVWRASGARARRTARVARGVAARSRSPAKKPRLAASAIRGTRGRVRPVWPRYSARSSRTWLTTVSVKRGARAGDGEEAYQGIHRVRSSRLCRQSNDASDEDPTRSPDRAFRVLGLCVSAGSAFGPRVASDRGDVRGARECARDLRPSRPLSAHKGLSRRGRETALIKVLFLNEPRLGFVFLRSKERLQIQGSFRPTRRCQRERARSRADRHRFDSRRGVRFESPSGEPTEGADRLSRARPTRAAAAP
jgi:hypothetical protein